MEDNNRVWADSHEISFGLIAIIFIYCSRPNKFFVNQPFLLRFECRVKRTFSLAISCLDSGLTGTSLFVNMNK